MRPGSGTRAAAAQPDLARRMDMLTLTDADRKQYENIWVVAEVSSGRIQPVTHELMVSKELADARRARSGL